MTISISSNSCESRNIVSHPWTGSDVVVLSGSLTDGEEKSLSEMKNLYCSSSLLLAAMLLIAKGIVRTVFFCNLTVKHSSDSSHPCFSLCSCYKLTKVRKLWDSCKTSCYTHTHTVCQRKCGFVLTLTHLSVFPLVPLGLAAGLCGVTTFVYRTTSCCSPLSDRTSLLSATMVNC